jgi:MFS family permease
MRSKLLSTFPAFKHQYYRYYFSGQLISLVGTWLQNIAQSWLVLQLTHSAFMVGFVQALQFLPVLFLGLLGGAIVDRFNTRYVLICTQIAAFILALTLGTLAFFNLVNVWVVAAFAFCLGIIQSFDAPARQSFTIEIVGKKDLSSAIALNMSVFNSARVIGPALAGFLITTVGNAFAFLLNAFSFLGPITALYFMKINNHPTHAQKNPLKAIKAGIMYAYHHPFLKSLLVFSAITSIFGFSYSTLLPVLTEQVFHLGATELGILFSSAGIGALIATVTLQFYMKHFSHEKIIVAASLLFSTLILVFSFVTNFYLALAVLFFASMALTTQMALTNTTVQHTADDAFRGRVMSLFTLSFMGMFPLGSFQMGVIAEHFGAPIAIRVSACVVFFAAIILHFTLKKSDSSLES